MIGTFDVGTRVAIVGGGKMGEAIMSGWLAATDGAAAKLAPRNFVVVEPNEERRAYLHERYGVECYEDGGQIYRADIVVLSVKPQNILEVLQKVRNRSAYGGGTSGPLFITIAAGMKVERLEAELPPKARLVRCMPNMPLLVAAGATAVCGGTYAKPEEVELVHDLFSCLGDAYVVEESEIDAITAVSGSGPAYVAALIEAMRDGGVAQGLSPEFAENLALQTVYGTAKLMLDAGQNAETTRISVSSPGGTTLAALEAMEKGGFSSSVVAGVAAAVRRSEELAGC